MPSPGRQEPGTCVSIHPIGRLSASVAVSRFSEGSSWTFSTLRTINDGSRPVRGHRRFTWTESDGFGTLTVRGVDRVSNPNWEAMSVFRNIFDMGDAVWQNFQQRLAEMLGPGATTGEPTTYRPDWDLVDAILRGDEPLSALEGCAP